MDERTINLYDQYIDLYWNEVELTKRDCLIQEKLWNIFNEVYLNYGDSKEVVFIALYGSQDYNMDTEDSDIDCQCFFFPTAEEIIFNKKFQSTTVPTKYGECVLKDVRSFFEELRKSSPNTLELLGTKYCIVNRDYHKIFSNMVNRIDTIARLNEYKLLKGYEGLYHKYTKDITEVRSMKYYVNAMRIMDAIDTITTLPDWTYQLVLEPSDAEYYRSIKKCNFDIIFRPDYFDNRCFETQMLLDNYFKNRFNDSVGWIQDLINNYQKQIMEKYLKLTF